MFSDKFTARLAGLAIIGAAMSLPGAASAGVVVKSTGPSADSYPVGRQVADDSQITLRAGDKITVLTDSGTKVMQGPGTFRVGENATRTRARFSALTRRGASTRARTGAVRGAGDAEPRMPNLWLLNVAQSGTTCLYDLADVTLWRPSRDEAQTFTITHQGTGTALDVNFVATETMRSLDPQGLQLMDGATYTITGPATAEGPATSVEVTIVAMGDTFRQPDELAMALVEKGCMTQLALLADTAEAEAS
jgi:hypothetical protein